MLRERAMDIQLKNRYGNALMNSGSKPEDLKDGKPSFGIKPSASCTRRKSFAMKQTSLRQLYCPANGDVGGTYEKKPDDTRRADLVMTEGFGLEVDGRMRTIFPTLGAAQKSALDIKTKYPMLQVKVYDAAKKTRTLVGSAASATPVPSR